MLFGILPDRIFAPFGGKYAQFYVHALERLHDGIFSPDYVGYLRDKDVQSELSAALDAWIMDLPPDERSEIKITGRMAYDELIETGWIAEDRDGWTKYAELTSAAALLLSVLCSLKHRRMQETMGGTMVSVLASIEAAMADPVSRAQGIAEAAKRSAEFVRFLRTVLGTLKAIQVEMLRQPDLNGLVRTFFGDFREKILLSDYSKLTSAANHPYRFRSDILLKVEEIHQEGDRYIDVMAAALVDQTSVSDVASARIMLLRNLDDISNAMRTIEIARDRIDMAKDEIERRFSNSLRYLDLMERDRNSNFFEGLSALGSLDVDKDTLLDIRFGLIQPVRIFDHTSAAKPVVQRRPVQTKVQRDTVPDPIHEAFRLAKIAFNDLITITPEKFIAYVTQKMEGRNRVTAWEIPPDDIQEFVIFSALRSLPMRSIVLPNDIVLERLDDDEWIENEWVESRNFELRRAMIQRNDHHVV
jgi:hypothetical protein